jgi:hypothetical protein
LINQPPKCDYFNNEKEIRIKMPTKVITSTAEAYFQYGVLGITVVALMLISSVLLMAILKDRKVHKQFADAIEKSTVNQKEFLILYEETQKRNEEILTVLKDTLSIERENTKKCYVDVSNKLDKLHYIIGRNL